MHSCKLFGTTGLAGGFLVTKKAPRFNQGAFLFVSLFYPIDPK